MKKKIFYKKEFLGLSSSIQPQTKKHQTQIKTQTFMGNKGVPRIFFEKEILGYFLFLYP